MRKKPTKKRKASQAQIAWRRRFALLAKSGAFAKPRRNDVFEDLFGEKATETARKKRHVARHWTSEGVGKHTGMKWGKGRKATRRFLERATGRKIKHLGKRVKGLAQDEDRGAWARRYRKLPNAVRLSAADIAKLSPSARAQIASSRAPARRSTSKKKRRRAPIRARKVIVGHTNPKRPFNMFRGRDSRRTYAARTRDGAPAVLKEAGGLRELVMVGGKRFRFHGPAKLVYSGQRLHLANVRFKPRGRRNPGEELDLGEVRQVTYTADKPHHGSPHTEAYYHNFGEEGGVRPRLSVYPDGYADLEGGSYRITPDGIID
jgi:hypothetical protein